MNNKAYVIMWRVRGEVTQRAIFFDRPDYDEALDFAKSISDSENALDVVVYESLDHWRVLVAGECVIERGPTQVSEVEKCVTRKPKEKKAA